MVLELSVVLGPAGARTKWRHGLVMQSQKATEGGMGSAHFFMPRDACGPREGLDSSPWSSAWPLFGQVGSQDRFQNGSLWCDVESQETDLSKRSRTSATLMCCLSTVTLVTV